MKLLRYGAWFVTAASTLLLVLTSLGAWFGESSLAGWNLWAHGALAPPFFMGLTVAVWCTGRQTSSRPDTAKTWHQLTQLSLWCLVIAGIATTTTVLLAMTTWIDQSGQHQLWQAHRFASFGVVLLLPTFLVCAWRLRAALRCVG